MARLHNSLAERRIIVLEKRCELLRARIGSRWGHPAEKVTAWKHELIAIGWALNIVKSATTSTTAKP